MFNGRVIDDLQEFLQWYKGLNPSEPIDMHEAITIYFNQEQYVVII